MLIRKYTLFLGLMVAALTTEAQVAEWADSSLIPPSRLAQHNEFVNNQYTFPAKPRSQWEIGIKLGSPSISGDVDALNPNFGVGIHARKALGYLVSVRGEIFTGSAKGLGVKENYNYKNNPAWNNKGYNSATDKVFYNYKTQLTDVSAQLLFNLTNIGFHKAEPKFSLYAIAGVGVTLYEANIDALNGSNTRYNFNSISPTLSASETRSALKALLDGTYETPAEKYKSGSGRSSAVSATFGVGAAFKISKKVNLAIENRFTVLDDDLLDGQKWGPFPAGNPSLSSNNDTYNFLSVGLNINIL
jgi:opacity protein-like surface antigen